MVTPRIGTFGTRTDLDIRQGATFGPLTLTFKNPDGSAVNLTGCSLTGQIRKQALSSTVVQAFTAAITDAAAGVATLTIDAVATAAIPAAETPISPDSRYVYDVELIDTQGRVIPVLYGDVVVLREVTR